MSLYTNKKYSDLLTSIQNFIEYYFISKYYLLITAEAGISVGISTEVLTASNASSWDGEKKGTLVFNKQMDKEVASHSKSIIYTAHIPAACPEKMASNNTREPDLPRLPTR